MAAIESYTAGKSFDAYAADRMLRDAVERNLERLSEASRHIPESLKGKHEAINWPGITALGNVLRHEYDQALDELIPTVIGRDRCEPIVSCLWT